MMPEVIATAASAVIRAMLAYASQNPNRYTCSVHRARNWGKMEPRGGQHYVQILPSIDHLPYQCLGHARTGRPFQGRARRRVRRGDAERCRGDPERHNSAVQVDGLTDRPPTPHHIAVTRVPFSRDRP